MEQLLAATGVFGVLAAIALGTLVRLVQPIWAIIDCVDSDRERDTKVLVSVLLFFTWAMGGLFYGLFFADSRSLRRFTIGVIVVLFLMIVGGVGACTLGAFQHAQRSQAEAELEREEAAVRLAEFSPAAIAPDALAPFPALLLVGGEMRRSASVADFTLAGPVAASARDVSSRIRHVAAAAGGLYALTDHDFGAVSPATGGLVEIGIDPRFEKEFSWPKGLAWDGASEKLVLMTSHIYTRFFTYDPRTAEWSLLPAERRGEQLIGLAWLREDGSLYALEVPGGGVRELETVQRFNTTGAHLGTLRLEPPIPLPPGLEKGFQLHASSGMLVLMIPPYEPGGEATASDARVYAIDPASGAVFAASPST